MISPRTFTTSRAGFRTGKVSGTLTPSTTMTTTTTTSTSTTTSTTSATKRPTQKPVPVLALVAVAVLLATVATVAVAATAGSSWFFRPADYAPIPKQAIRIFGPAPMVASSNAKSSVSSSASSADRTVLLQSRHVHYQLLSRDDQWTFLQSRRGRACWPNVKERYISLSKPYQLELFKYCFIVMGYGNVYLDEGMTWLIDPLETLKPYQSTVIQAPIQQPSNTNDHKNNNYYHTSFLQLHKKHVARRMVQFLMETPIKTLESSPLLIPAQLHELMQPVTKVEYQSTCQTTSNSEPCRLSGGFCCQVMNGIEVVATLHHPVLSPTFHNTIHDNNDNNNINFMAQRNHLQSLNKIDKNFVSTITVHTTGNLPASPMETPNFFDILLHNDCLPTTKTCYKCLKRPTSSCIECATECGCYCQKALCQMRPPSKVVTQVWHVHPPHLAVRHRSEAAAAPATTGTSRRRWIPRLVHQTWFEPVTPDKYPNMSRLIESWKQSGWEYAFYDDDRAAAFLSEHFPPEVREAYDSILPGAFKADLFRYCVLLIKGGIYADMDVLLESNLDAVLQDDVGFMVPIDEPGSGTGHRSCLWNGLLAVAPGHAFMARTIERVVNNIRNRFTSVDYDDMLCPNPILSVSHTVDTLFTCGPCILGAAMNEVLGRHMQSEWELGEVNVWSNNPRNNDNGIEGSQAITPIADDDPRHAVFGRTIILAQNKQDMGAHRFTWQSRHMMVAATDMPDYDDRPPTKQHYSRTHEKTGVYGLRNLYKDNKKANELIQIVVKLDG